MEFVIYATHQCCLLLNEIKKVFFVLLPYSLILDKVCLNKMN